MRANIEFISKRRGTVAISGNYSTPVTVNGFSCKNCSDVDRAKKFIDPDKPQDGPFGINKTATPTEHRFSDVAQNALLLGKLHRQQTAPVSAAAQGYSFGGSLAPGTLVQVTA